MKIGGMSAGCIVLLMAIVYFYSPLYAILLLVLILGAVVGLIAMKDVVLGRTVPTPPVKLETKKLEK